MHEDVFRALESGATILTAGRRLARVLAREFHAIAVERGGRVWGRPDILPLDAFLDRTWAEWLGRYACEDTPVLLSAAQEQMLWERIVRESPAGESLLQIPETARQAMETWRLVAEYRLPVDGRFEAAEDWSAFAGWSREFRRRCSLNRWLERARLGDFLRERITAGESKRPASVYMAGFDEITPQQADFLRALGRCPAIEMRDCSPTPQRRKLRDSSDEIRSAAAWARRLLENDPETKIGIVVAPDLARCRPKVERILSEILEPGRGESDRERAFHLSVGPALAEYPIIRAALLMLEFIQGKLPLARAGMLLRSPFLGGAEKEWQRRAQLDAKLRRIGVWDVSMSDLRKQSGSCPVLQRVLRRVEKQCRTNSNEQHPSEWVRSIEDMLEAFGWPGDRGLDSREFQTAGAWQGLLSNLSALDLVAPPMTLGQVIDWLHQQTSETRFQIEDEDAPVQVMGMLEAAGLRFDHLWIMGLHDEAVPAAANPNPFLPMSLQLEHKLPHASAERELEFAATLMGRLLESAPDVVLSYPAAEGDRALAPSPIVAVGNWLDEGEPAANDWIACQRAAAVFEEINDDTGPELAASGSQGGASLFKDMAACPFRSFAKHRLGARPLEETDLGLSYRDRGSTVHTALECIWRELGSQAQLIQLDPPELQALIERGADAAVLKLGPGIGRNIEKMRLQKLLAEWLELEKSRPEFAVATIEGERVVAMGGLEVRVRADRVDALPDGREVIFDYKTGQLKSHGWEGDRPDEPQLPLYCTTNDRPVAAAAFAMIRTGELRYRGLAESDVTLPTFTKMAVEPAIPFSDQLAEWRGVLERLAEDYRAGNATVDPKPGACDNCGLRGLCRIREAQSDRR